MVPDPMSFLLLGADPPARGLGGLAHLWMLWLPLLIGGLAILLLLPRPRPLPWFLGTVAGLASLLLGALLLVRGTGLNPETVLFYAFAALAVVSGALLVTQANPARAALSFTLVVLSTGGLFLLLAAPFLMAATVIVYAGAIIVTFLFVLMLAQQAGHSSADARSREPELTTLTGFLLLATIIYVLHTGYGTQRIDPLIHRVEQAHESAAQVAAEADPARQRQGLEELRQQIGETGSDQSANLFHQCKALVNAYGLKDLHNSIEAAEDPTLFVESDLRGGRPDDVVRKTAETYARSLAQVRDTLIQARQRLGQAQPAAAGLSPLSGTPASTPAAEVRRDERTGLPALPAENSAYLGRSLFTDYLLPVELAGMLLLVATVGAIAIAQRRPDEGDVPGRPA